MAQYSFTEKKRIRKSFAKRASVLPVPFLLETQLSSYRAFLQEFTAPESRKNEGLQAAFTSIFPISSHSGNARLEFVGYSLLGFVSCRQGLARLAVDPARLAADLDANWDVLAEPVQTVLRRYGVANAYEQLKELTRGKGITRDALHAFIDGLQIPADARARLKALTPATYIGKAAELARRIQSSSPLPPGEFDAPHLPNERGG